MIKDFDLIKKLDETAPEVCADTKLTNVETKIDGENSKSSVEPQQSECKKEPEDKDKTPRLANPVGFKRVKTVDCFADIIMDIPAENPNPVTLPYSPTALNHKFKRVESSAFLPHGKYDSKRLSVYKKNDNY